MTVLSKIFTCIENDHAHQLIKTINDDRLKTDSPLHDIVYMNDIMSEIKALCIASKAAKCLLALSERNFTPSSSAILLLKAMTSHDFEAIISLHTMQMRHFNNDLSVLFQEIVPLMHDEAIKYGTPMNDSLKCYFSLYSDQQITDFLISASAPLTLQSTDRSSEYQSNELLLAVLSQTHPYIIANLNQSLLALAIKSLNLLFEQADKKDDSHQGVVLSSAKVLIDAYYGKDFDVTHDQYINGVNTHESLSLVEKACELFEDYFRYPDQINYDEANDFFSFLQSKCTHNKVLLLDLLSVKSFEYLFSIPQALTLKLDAIKDSDDLTKTSGVLALLSYAMYGRKAPKSRVHIIKTLIDNDFIRTKGALDIYVHQYADSYIKEAFRDNVTRVCRDNELVVKYIISTFEAFYLPSRNKGQSESIVKAFNTKKWNMLAEYYVELADPVELFKEPLNETIIKLSQRAHNLSYSDMFELNPHEKTQCALLEMFNS